MVKQNKSVEPQVADIINGWLKQYKLDYKLEQEPLNQEIDSALNNYFSKNGGKGGNRPDVKILLRDKYQNSYPILIEYKGYKDKLEKLDFNNQYVLNVNKNSKPHLNNIKSYAVNVAVHYANALLEYTQYKKIIAIGATGYKENNKIKLLISVYFVSPDNYGLGQKINKNFDDLSFLKKDNFDDFINKTINTLHLSDDDLEILKEQREAEIDASIKKLNNDIYSNEDGLSESDRVYLVAASIIANLGVVGKIKPLQKEDLKSSSEKNNRDGDILIRKIQGFLSEKNLPKNKYNLIIRTLENTVLDERINKVQNGETQLKRIYAKVIDDLGIYYKIGLTTDFTGRLFNEMFSWLGFTQDKMNDVVLTPPYVAKLLVKLARVNMNSYVWDFATGSAGLLVAAMNEMVNDAKENINSSDELKMKVAEIKANQLLGLELLPSIYMLAVLNMILMGDGSSNILNMDSLTEFEGKISGKETDQDFPADAFILNPPYSKEGKGMIFVEHALSMMNKGYAAVIVQSSAGSGKAKEINKRILKRNTLLASIKMPNDIFIGKSSVQTHIYVFRVNEKHESKSKVKFIDFSYDGYSRSNRRKAKHNLKNIDCAKERYEEVVNLVKFGKNELNYLGEDNYYESEINPESGIDWNKTKPVSSMPKLEDFEKTVTDYLEFELSNVLHNRTGEANSLGK